LVLDGWSIIFIVVDSRLGPTSQAGGLPHPLHLPHPPHPRGPGHKKGIYFLKTNEFG